MSASAPGVNSVASQSRISSPMGVASGRASGTDPGSSGCSGGSASPATGCVSDA
jgi:hypothetical protein